jgi:hypothetical protein
MLHSRDLALHFFPAGRVSSSAQGRNDYPGLCSFFLLILCNRDFQPRTNFLITIFSILVSIPGQVHCFQSRSSLVTCQDRFLCPLRRCWFVSRGPTRAGFVARSSSAHASWSGRLICFCAPRVCVPSLCLIFPWSLSACQGLVLVSIEQAPCSATDFLLLLAVSSGGSPMPLVAAHGKVHIFLMFFDSDLVRIFVGDSWYSYWVVGSEDLMVRGSNRFFTIIFWTRPPDVRWNNCEDINSSLIWFLSSILHVFLLGPIHISVAVPNPVLRVDS